MRLVESKPKIPPNTREEIRFPHEDEVQYGKIALGVFGYGTRYPVDPALGLGFSSRFASPPDTDQYSQMAHDENVAIVTDMALRALKKRDQDGVDFLCVTSASSKTHVVKEAADKLRSMGITIDNTKFIGNACAGIQAAVVDFCSNPMYYGANILIIPHERLTGSAMNPSPGNLIPLIFGNACGYMGFKAGVDISHIWGRTIVIQNNALLTPKAYDLPMDEKEIPIPDYYEFPSVPMIDQGYNEQTRNNLNPEEREKLFRYTRSGSYLKIPEASPYAVMDGPQLLYWFAKNGGKLFAEDILLFKKLFPQLNLGSSNIHQPTEPVFYGLEKEFWDNILEFLQISLDPKSRRMFLKGSHDDRMNKLTELGFTQYTDIEPLTWVMDKTPFNNVSSVTPLIQLLVSIRDGKIKSDRITPMRGLGIGSMFLDHFMQIHHLQD